MEFEHILVERSGDFATVIMNRLQRRNALSLAHMRELITAFRDLGDSDPLGIVLAGNGPVFCAGHDFADVADADQTVTSGFGARAYSPCTRGMLAAITRSRSGFDGWSDRKAGGAPRLAASIFRHSDSAACGS